MIKNFIATIFALTIFATTLHAAEPDLLRAIDQQAAVLVDEMDPNRGSYLLQQWRERVEKTLEYADTEAFEAYEFQTLKKVYVGRDSLLIMYFIKRHRDAQSVIWFPTNEKTQPFVDRFSTTPTTLALEAKPYIYKALSGFELVDAVGKQIFVVPDIRLRLAFEIISDIRKSTELKQRALVTIDDRLTTLFRNVDVMTLDLRGLPRLMVIENENKTLRIATYMVVYDDFDSKCFGIIMRQTSRGVLLTRLNDNTENIKLPERTKCNAKSWYGAIYSSVVELKMGKETYYTLIGYKSNDGLVKTRVIETLSFSGDKCQFGAPIFVHDRATYLRRVFKYSAQVNMMIRFDEKLQMIVFDHLSPSNTMFRNEYRYYGPDFSYDAYEHTKKGWIFSSDIDLRNQ